MQTTGGTDEQYIVFMRKW